MSLKLNIASDKPMGVGCILCLHILVGGSYLGWGPWPYFRPNCRLVHLYNAPYFRQDKTGCNIAHILPICFVKSARNFQMQCRNLGSNSEQLIIYVYGPQTL